MSRRSLSASRSARSSWGSAAVPRRASATAAVSTTATSAERRSTSARMALSPPSQLNTCTSAACSVESECVSHCTIRRVATSASSRPRPAPPTPVPPMRSIWRSLISPIAIAAARTTPSFVLPSSFSSGRESRRVSDSPERARGLHPVVRLFEHPHERLHRPDAPGATEDVDRGEGAEEIPLLHGRDERNDRRLAANPAERLDRGEGDVVVGRDHERRQPRDRRDAPPAPEDLERVAHAGGEGGFREAKRGRVGVPPRGDERVDRGRDSRFVVAALYEDLGEVREGDVAEGGESGDDGAPNGPARIVELRHELLDRGRPARGGERDPFGSLPLIVRERQRPTRVTRSPRWRCRRARRPRGPRPAPRSRARSARPSPRCRAHRPRPPRRVALGPPSPRSPRASAGGCRS